MPQPLAIWNSARDAWETPQTEGLFCEHSDVYSETFPTSGMTLNGVAYALPTWEPAMDVSASSSLRDGGLLRTPMADEGRKASNRQGAASRKGHQIWLTSQIVDLMLLKTPTSQLAVNGGSQHPDKRKAGGHGPTLADEVEHLLPTPVAQPSGNTPENHLRKKPGRVVVTDLAILVENDMLTTGGKLLPTPVVTDSTGTRNRTANRNPTLKPANVGDTLNDVIWVQNGWKPGDTQPPWEKSTGASMGPQSAAGNQLWEDVPLPLPNPRDATTDTD